MFKGGRSFLTAVLREAKHFCQMQDLGDRHGHPPLFVTRDVGGDRIDRRVADGKDSLQYPTSPPIH